MQIFTRKERTQKNYTVGQAVEQARQVLRSQFPNIGMCMNSARRYESSDSITMEKFSEIVYDLVDDSIYHAGGYHYDIS